MHKLQVRNSHAQLQVHIWELSEIPTKILVKIGFGLFRKIGLKICVKIGKIGVKIWVNICLDLFLTTKTYFYPYYLKK